MNNHNIILINTNEKIEDIQTEDNKISYKYFCEICNVRINIKSN